jgi:methionine biosynthesis protein MetW
MSARTDNFDMVWNTTDLKGMTSKFDHLVQFLPSDAQTILDIGAGNGALHSAFKKHRKITYTGVDASLEGVRHIELEGGVGIQSDVDGVRLPFDDNSFDAVFACDILEHVRDPWVLLGEMARVSRKYVVIYGPNFVSLKCRLQVLMGNPPYQMTTDKHGSVFDRNGYHVDHIYFITRNNILHWSKKMHLRVSKTEAYWYRRYAPFRWFLEPLFGNWGEVYRILLVKDSADFVLPNDKNVQINKSSNKPN